tara:strand:- start:237 stop:419 length:183 start_codon:yes stop_codon:yes gene_type:complete
MSKGDRKMSIAEAREQIENEIVVQESARTTKRNENPMNSEEVSEAQEDSRNVTRIGEHMI